MICNYFLYSKRYDSPFDAMDEFDRQRCKDSRGVTIPSQRRYVEYYADYLKNNRVYTTVEFKLKSIRILNAKPHFSTLGFQVMNKESFEMIFESKCYKTDTNDLVFEASDSIVLKNDIRFTFLNKKKVFLIDLLGFITNYLFMNKKEHVFSISLNTLCLLMQEDNCSNEQSCLGSKFKENDQIIYKLKPRQIDNLAKNKKLHENFEVSLSI